MCATNSSRIKSSILWKEDGKVAWHTTEVAVGILSGLWLGVLIHSFFTNEKNDKQITCAMGGLFAIAALSLIGNGCIGINNEVHVTDKIKNLIDKIQQKKGIRT